MIDFTKLLPSMKSGQELISALSIIPKYDESICEQDQTVRLVALSASLYAEKRNTDGNKAEI